MTDATRQAIKELFDTIRGTFGSESSKLVMRRPINVDRVFGQFSPTQSFGAFTPRGVTAGTGAAGVNITGPITVVADNPDAFLRELQKKAGRTSASATGRFPGRSLGLS